MTAHGPIAAYPLMPLLRLRNELDSKHQNRNTLELGPVMHLMLLTKARWPQAANAWELFHGHTTGLSLLLV